MIKKEFVELYCTRHNIEEKQGQKDIENFLDTLKYALTIDKNLIFRNFGSFEVRKTKERVVVDPKNISKKIDVKSRKYVKFKISRTFEDKLAD
ncbi:MAG: HU family DNA-binding protein [Fusobacterium perfoetens]|uniref:HU family DNA-binding protein n=1 Tax=Fusobacterium perfoetens TaxID=852 RepID=UPI0023F413FB|nr:HU family DNA-binding protein [Fusobacterium perfoetens]MCI6152363.1 HU family DNA-binding protein [Fusobacterium perfoetens]MDY3236962.1 HU family DNA-binding protein [Fusobacterium perfoetens]